MTTSHTPGPWALNRGGDETYRVIDATDMNELSVIATVHFHDDGEGETKANAKLIAAAPNLLAALQAIVAGSWNDDYELILKNARAAIAKATS